jgi:predicted TPR repeat methyltransferase
MTTYDQAYFDGGKGYSKYDYSGQFEKWADQIIQTYHPTNVLDLGCAKGFLVKALRDRGVPAWGIDISEYAIAQAPEDVADFLYLWDITSADQLEVPTFDLIVSTDTFEHIPEDKLHLTKMFMLNHGKRFYIKVATPDTPNWEHDPTHITIKPLDFWQEFFEDCNFEASK